MEPSSPSVTSSETVTIIDGPRAGSRARAEPAPPPGTELSRYVVLDVLGTGGMGEVLRAYDPRLHREVALKRLRPGELDSTAAERMVREAQAMAQLTHPNVVAVYDVEQLESTVLLAMELVDGTTLGRYVQDEEPSWPQVVALFASAGQGLAAAHAAGLVHRDFKPANVLVGTDGRVKVTDFGLARPVSDRSPSSVVPAAAQLSGSHPSLSTTMTQAGVVMGTPAYMAPEQHLGEEADAKADQFAFCVSLWQALTGSRPFVGDYRQVAAAKVKGPPEWPTGSPVPRRIVDAIVRGLAVRPVDRWPSMEALLAILERDPARTRMRIVTASAIGIAAVATLGAIAGWWTRPPPVCEGAADHLIGIWDEKARSGVQQAMRATELEYAEPTLVAVERRLDTYADDWIEMHTEACRATSVRGEQSTAVLDLRMGCLQRRLHSLEATVEVLTEADAAVVEDAVPLVADLPTLAACADVDALTAAIPPPDDPRLADAVDEARLQIARAEASMSVGRIEDARTLLDELSPRAVEYAPLAAEAGFSRGMLELGLRQYDEAESILGEAYQQALRAGDLSTASQTLSGLAFTIGARRLREEEAMWLIRTALAIAEHLENRELQGVVLNDMAGILQTHAHHEEAIEIFERGLAIQTELFGEKHPSVTTTMSNMGLSLLEGGDFERAFTLRTRVLELERQMFGETHPRIARLLHTMGNSLHQRGEYEASVERLRQAVAMYTELLGPEHPETAHALSGLGLALSALGRNTEAEQHVRTSFEILERTVGLENLEVIDTLNNLAIIVDAQGRYEESLELHQRMLEATEALLGPDHPRTALALNNVAGELVSLRRFEEAQPLLERAIEVMTKALGPEHPHLSIFRFNLGDTLLGLDQPAEAEALYRQAMPVIEQAFGAEHVYTSYGNVGLGRALLAQERRTEALDHLERGLELRRQDGVPDSDRAEAAFALARALQPDDPERARELAREAKTLLKTAGPGQRHERAEIDAWLAAVAKR